MGIENFILFKYKYVIRNIQHSLMIASILVLMKNLIAMIANGNNPMIDLTCITTEVVETTSK